MPANHLVYDGSCGFGGFGQGVYIQNNDASHAYRVTVKATVNDVHISYLTRYVNAGERQNIGCTQGPGNPPDRHDYEITGEVRA
ncbi:MAG TPA: hypothetical protein VK588_15055 [Chitinophagaceae bacterium]|nr:hypothetical protein [Chitinophagaceae bacterium]